jgi:glycerol uptake facilitator protein
MNQFTAELIGTAVLILLGGGVVANVVLEGTKGNNSGLMVIATAWGLAVFVGIIIAGPTSGAHLNPAVTLTLALAGKFPWSKVPLFMGAQFLGAMIGSFFVWLMHYDHFKITQDPEAKLSVFCTSPAIRNYSLNLLSEVLGTFILVFVVLYIKDGEIKSGQPVPIGLGSVGALPVAFLVWGIGLSLGGTTGYAINPVRDLGPRILYSILPIPEKRDPDWAYSWIPVFGPFIGAILAAGLFRILN